MLNLLETGIPVPLSITFVCNAASERLCRIDLQVTPLELSDSMQNTLIASLTGRAPPSGLTRPS